MSRIIDLELEELKALVYRMGDLAYQVVSMAIEESFRGGDLYHKIQGISDMLVILAEQVEDKTFEIIARFQPVASDLRAVKSYMKISYDFTRFGRYALDISYLNKRFGGLKESIEWIRIYTMEMGEKVLAIIDSLKGGNIEAARRISEMEKEVDELYFNFLDKIIGEKNIESRIIVLSALIVRYFERIVDHAAYICESLIYALTGRKEFLR
ncbi:MAG: PhoU domain-containing protein [Candidatus Bathyarchaeia archaeon]